MYRSRLTGNFLYRAVKVVHMYREIRGKVLCCSQPERFTGTLYRELPFQQVYKQMSNPGCCIFELWGILRRLNPQCFVNDQFYTTPDQFPLIRIVAIVYSQHLFKNVCHKGSLFTVERNDRCIANLE